MDTAAAKAFQDNVAEIRQAKREILAAITPLEQKPFAVQSPNGQTWICRPDATRFAVADVEQLNAYIFTGQCQGLGTGGVPRVDEKFLSGWRLSPNPKG